MNNTEIVEDDESYDPTPEELEGLTERGMEAANWLRKHGYNLCIDTGHDCFRASISGEGRRYSTNILHAIVQVHEWVIQESPSGLTSDRY